MEIAGRIVALIGMLVFVIGWWGAIREIFGESRAMGYLSFLVPAVPLIWTVIHWDDLKRECIFMFVGLGMIVGGVLLSPRTGAA